MLNLNSSDSNSIRAAMKRVGFVLKNNGVDPYSDSVKNRIRKFAFFSGVEIGSISPVDWLLEKWKSKDPLVFNDNRIVKKSIKRKSVDKKTSSLYDKKSRLPVIYMIKHIPTGKFYIGSTVCFEARMFNHQESLKKDAHHNSRLQALFNLSKGDFSDFEFSVIFSDQSIDRISLYKKEQYYIDALNPEINIERVVKPPNKGRFFSSRHRKGSVATLHS